MRFYWPIAKIDREQRMVYGYASTEAEDDQGEIVKREALAAALDDYMKFANIREMHQASAIGVAKEAAIDGKGLYVAARIVDEEAWVKVVEGVYKGFSIGGRVTARDPTDRSLITGLALTEISVVDRPANPEAVFDCWKRSGEPAAAREAGRGPTGADPAGDYADPGYQPDGRRRYPLDSGRHIRAAWAYIHLPRNAARYSADQLAQIKARIIAAWRERIDPHGPPAGQAHKSLDETGALAQIVLDLDALQRRLAMADASPLPGRLGEIVADLCDILDALVAEEGGASTGDGDGPPANGFAAAAVAGMLRRSRRQAAGSEQRLLEKLAGEIVPRLDALQRRVDEIASTPLPPQTIARGIAAIAKRDDAGPDLPTGDELAAALARMSEEERTLTLIKAAHANPIDPFARPR